MFIGVVFYIKKCKEVFLISQTIELNFEGVNVNNVVDCLKLYIPFLSQKLTRKLQEQHQQQQQQPTVKDYLLRESNFFVKNKL